MNASFRPTPVKERPMKADADAAKIVSDHIAWIESDIECLLDQLWDEHAKPQLDQRRISQIQSNIKALEEVIERYRSMGLCD
jgi:peptidoglycan hydrolase CwlO-like protein